MPTLLQIDSSPRGERSISRQLTRTFALAWQENHPGGRVIRRDLRDVPVPHLDEAWVASAKVSTAERTEEDRHRLELSEELITELKTADHFVFGVPMHNYTVPSNLKAYIDTVVRSGLTVSYTKDGLATLLEGKSATAITASSSRFSDEASGESWDFLAPYLRKILTLLASDVEVIAADGLADLSQRDAILNRALEKIRVRALLPAATVQPAELVH